MFRKEFLEIIKQTGMIPLKDLKVLSEDISPNTISELELLQFSFFDDVKFAKQLSLNHSLPFIDLSQAKIQEASLKLIKRSDAIKFRSIPIQKNSKGIMLAIFDPSIKRMFSSELQVLFQTPVDFILTNLSSWKKIFLRLQDSVEDLVTQIKEIKQDLVGQSSSDKVMEKDIGEDVIKYVNKILASSFLQKASDIHVEPYEKNFRVRFRLDGNLITVLNPPRNLMLPVLSRLKIMSQMDISERRRPQDGRIKLQIGGSAIDYRVSCLPTLFGEKIVLRLLDSQNLQLDMTKLGLEEKQLEVWKRAINKPFGMCLVTGPTGSGKTTTLYSSIHELNTGDVNISTVEDPVEFNLEGINQVNVNKDVDLTFANALRSFLRQDPDIILVGEIRDKETAAIAIEASLTGHLVLSTLHTNDAAATITRLINMGIEPFLVSGALNVVVAQRLCRKICEHCKEEATEISSLALIECGISAAAASKVRPKKGKGCSLCLETGYKGRVAIYEVLEVSGAIKQAITKRSSAEEIKYLAIQEGMKTLRMSALTKVAQGIITLEEAVGNSASDKDVFFKSPSSSSSSSSSSSEAA